MATRPIDDLEAYRQPLTRFVYQTGMFMRPVFSAAKLASAKRVAYAEGEDERVLRAVQLAIDEGLAQPILIGRPAVIESRIEKAGLRIKLGTRRRDASTPRTIRASATTGRPTTSSWAATASRPRRPRRRCAAPTPPSAR